ncbi:MAG TPA: tRNA (adenosine(37)-N6)-threonylcarbamoyltransferase complex ATPase subunit type 1 TsaE [Actinomycetota bacterium]|nr:tRNA (adenosine(37)-N6)-threonylcarbamoyltransferase complex ATPase subunit type 1 TsaE [Actinomycetota bacterium]
MAAIIETATADDTRAVGAALAGLLVPGDVLVLTGDLGAGKTTLTQGIAKGLGATEHVASPTFTLVREYVTGRLPVAHVDVYRLRRAQDVLDLALDELDGGHDGVLIVEWGDAVADLLGADRLRIELTAPDPVAETRRIAVEGTGAAWTRRVDAVAATLAPWEARP